MVKTELPREDWPIPVPFLAEVGRIALLWSTLENLLNMLLGKLAGYDDLEDPTAFIIFTHASFPQRLDILGALCEHLKSAHPHLAAAPRVVGRLKEAQALRNKFLHCGLEYDDATGTCLMARGTARGRLRVGVVTVTLDDLRQSAMDIHLATCELYKLVLKKDRWSEDNG